MSVTGIVLLVGGGLLLFAGVFVAIGVVRMRMVRGWVSTTGIIVNKPDILGLPSKYPTFRWRDSYGREHQYTSSVGSSLRPRPGTLVEVKYDPHNPSRGMLTGIAQSGLLFLIIGGMFVLLAVLMLVMALVLVSA